VTGSGFIGALERGRRVARARVGAASVVVALMIWPAVAVSSPHRQTPETTRSRSSTESVLKVLAGNGIGRALFGDARTTVVRRLDVLLGRPPSKNYYPVGRGGGVDHEIDWPLLAVYFGHGRFVGYEYGLRTPATNEPVLATAKGLRIGDTVAVAERLYGRTFEISAAQGGSWLVTTPHGRLIGYTSDVTNLKGRILAIDAGHVGTPALTP
jgi:hypothetical protein